MISARSVRPASLRLMTIAAAILVAVSQTGCNYFILLGYLIGGPPAIAPDFEVATKKSFTDADVTVAVVCFAPPEVKWDFDEIDLEVAKYLTYRLVEHHVKVINPDRVRAWLDANPNWDKPEEIGEAFDCKYVVYIDLHHYTLYEENSTQLYRGRCDGWVSVVEMSGDGSGEKIFSKELNSVYPRQVPRSTSEVSFMNFKRQYLSRLSEEIGWFFYEHYEGDNFGDAA